MKIPDSIIVCGIPYKVSRVPFLVGESGDMCFGMARQALHEIVLHANVPTESMSHIFFHELFHVVCNAYGIKDDEQLIRQIAAPLYDTLQRNGLLTDA